MGNLCVQELRTLVPCTRPASRDEKDGWLAMERDSALKRSHNIEKGKGDRKVVIEVL